MSLDWRDYYTLACDLASNNSPANKRISINRSYYSVFFSLKNLIENKAYLDRNNKK